MFNENNIKYVQNFDDVTTCEFLLLQNYLLIFFQISTNNEKFTLKFVSIALAKQDTILPVIGEITRIKRY